MARPQLTIEQTEQTRTELLDVAQRLYEDAGVEGMSFRSIASAHGCSPTKPYLYFDSKADLIDGLRIRAYEWLRDVLTDATQNTDGPLVALRALAEAYVRAGLDRPRMYELLYSQDGAMPESTPALVDAKNRAIGVCRQVIEEAVESGDLEPMHDTDTVAHLFWVSAHGLVSLEHGGFLVVGKTIDELLPALFSSVVRGTSESHALQSTN